MSRRRSQGFVWALALSSTALVTATPQTPPPPVQGTTTQQQQTGTPTQPPAGQRGGQGGRGRGGIQVLALTTTGWTDGATIPEKYTQAGDEVSPPLAWTDPPATTASFVLIAHDLDATNNTGSDVMHWMLWNIPPATRSLTEHVPQGPQLPDGTRQISATGPYDRGPAAPASGPPHHYVFELFAVDTLIDVPAVGATVANTRTAVVTAMTGHVVAKGTLVGSFKRTP